MKIATLIMLLMLGACTAEPVVKTEKILPYWIDGISNINSAMLDKNIYWLNKIEHGKATEEDKLKLIKSNIRFYRGMIDYIQAQKENFVREQQEDQENADAVNETNQASPK